MNNDPNTIFSTLSRFGETLNKYGIDAIVNDLQYNWPAPNNIGKGVWEKNKSSILATITQATNTIDAFFKL